MKRVRWGVLGAAAINRKVVPGLHAGEMNEVVALASRSLDKGREMASQLKIPRVHGSYEELLEDEEIDAVYIPLPNHLHVEWSIRALDAGKHVLCEKPLGMQAGEVEKLVEHARSKPDLKVMEAFMYRFHPQWQRARDLVAEGALGRLQAVHSTFSYYKDDPGNIRNRAESGGGGMLDIGCYCVSVARYLWGEEPTRVAGLVEYDPQFGVDRLASGILEFPRGQASFTCATQLVPYQRVQAFGDEGRLEVVIPFNAPPDSDLTLILERNGESERLTIAAADQYALQGEAFARAIGEGEPVPTPLDDALANMRAVDAVFEGSSSGRWVELPSR